MDEVIDSTVAPSGTGCVECLAGGDPGWWFHLRRCASCGHIGCCDASPSQHATAHYRATATPSSPAPNQAGTGSGTSRRERSPTRPELAAPPGIQVISRYRDRPVSFRRTGATPALTLTWSPLTQLWPCASVAAPAAVRPAIATAMTSSGAVHDPVAWSPAPSPSDRSRRGRKRGPGPAATPVGARRPVHLGQHEDEDDRDTAALGCAAERAPQRPRGRRGDESDRQHQQPVHTATITARREKPRWMRKGTLIAPMMPSTWNTDELSPAAARLRPRSSASRLGNQAVMPCSRRTGRRTPR